MLIKMLHRTKVVGSIALVLICAKSIPMNNPPGDALIHALQYKNVKAAESLFAQGRDPYAQDHNGKPLIFYATTKKTAELFFKYGLKVNDQKQFFALMKNSLEPNCSSKLIPFFIAQGATVASYAGEDNENLFTLFAHRIKGHLPDRLVRKIDSLLAPLTPEETYVLLNNTFTTINPWNSQRLGYPNFKMSGELFLRIVNKKFSKAKEAIGQLP